MSEVGEEARGANPRTPRVSHHSVVVVSPVRGIATTDEYESGSPLLLTLLQLPGAPPLPWTSSPPDS